MIWTTCTVDRCNNTARSAAPTRVIFVACVAWRIFPWPAPWSHAGDRAGQYSGAVAGAVNQQSLVLGFAEPAPYVHRSCVLHVGRR